MRPVRAAAVLAAGAVLGATALSGSSGASGPPRVVARDADGAVVASLPLGRDGSFGLAYRHSYERAPAEERYRARPGGGFELRAIRSPDAGVLDYYELAGARRRAGATWTLALDWPARFATLDLAATAHGRRTLVVGGARAVLHPPRGTAHVTIEVEGP